MSKVVVVTDSVSNLTSSLAEAGGVHLVPFYVLLGEKTFRDADPEVRKMVYRVLRENREATTSHPTVMDYVNIFTSIREKGAEILYLTVSKAWTFSTDIALEAARRVGDRGIAVLDTKTALGHLGLLALEAANFAREGKTLEEVSRYAEALVKRGNLFFVLDTLKYLARGGRIGRASSLLGSALRLRPVLTARDGVADVASKTFSEQQALRWILKHLRAAKESLKREKMLVSVEVGDRLEWKELLKKSIREEHPDAQIFDLEMSPVVTCHTGPGIWGISYLFP